ncbi:hypothetical protein Ciccas_006271 [Cichlidogyrus casuarinus]|uniref:Tyrosine-protein kinase n=1 Tax=Cichlidogyrus casuarinus TaxID=1844966 RepID=A0ABD2Q6A9_9PLAT
MFHKSNVRTVKVFTLPSPQINRIINKPNSRIVFRSTRLNESTIMVIRKTQQRRNLTKKSENPPQCLDAWFNISRDEAEKKLTAYYLKSGTYLLRPSSIPQSLTLSFRIETNSECVVLHKRISRASNGNYSFQNHNLSFGTVQELLQNYKIELNLTEACPRGNKLPVTFDEFEVDRQSIKKVRDLGRGSFGSVFQATWKNSMQVAVKTHLPAMNNEAFMKEARTMHKLQHPRILRLLGVCTKPANQPIYIITELMTKGSLKSFLKSPEGRKLPLANLLDIMAQVCDGMAYLEKHNVLHRDLRAANVLVGDDNSVKVADFGLARDSEGSAGRELFYFWWVYFIILSVGCFPIKWTAPEAALLKKFSIKSDVWSFGVLIYEIVTYGAEPYPSMQNLEVMVTVSKGFRMPNPSTSDKPCPDSLYDVMNECWDADPDERPTFAHLFYVFTNW